MGEGILLLRGRWENEEAKGIKLDKKIFTPVLPGSVRFDVAYVVILTDDHMLGCTKQTRKSERTADIVSEERGERYILHQIILLNYFLFSTQTFCQDSMEHAGLNLVDICVYE